MSKSIPQSKTRSRAQHSPAPSPRRIAQPVGRSEAAKERRKLPVVDAQRTQVPCLSCGLCCGYIAVEIDGPSTLETATNILWYLYHRDVSVYVEDDEWMIQFETRCQHLADDNRCGIYETRPPICRQFDETSCEVNAAEVGVSMYSATEFMAYLERNHKRIHTMVRKRYWPADAQAPSLPARYRPRLPAFRPRFEALRVQGSAR